MASIYKRGSVYWITWWDNGQKQSKSLKTSNRSVALNKKKLLEAKTTLGLIADEKKNPAINQALSAYLTNLELENSHAHYRNTKQALERFVTWSGCATINALSADKITKYRELLLQNTSGGTGGVSTARHFMQYVRGWLNWLERNNHIKHKPVKYFPMPKPRQQPPRFCSQEEAQWFLDNSEGLLHDEIVFALYTGARPSEMRRLLWTDINLEAGHVVLKGKNKKIRYIPLSPLVRKMARPRRTGHMFPWVDIPNKRGWNRLRAASGYDGIDWYTWRHTFASWLVMAGVDLPTVQYLMGHSQITTTMIYAHLSPAHTKKAIATLPVLIGQDCSQNVAAQPAADSQNTPKLTTGRNTENLLELSATL